MPMLSTTADRKDATRSLSSTAQADAEARQRSLDPLARASIDGGKSDGNRGDIAANAGGDPSQLGCPYHSRILQPRPKTDHVQGLSPMDRFLAEGPALQSSLFIRADTGKLSIDKGCMCPDAAESKNSGVGS